VLFGHSAGGFVALHLAIRHPDLPGGLILCDTGPTLAPLPDDDPPPSLADRAGPEAVAVAARLLAGDFSPATFEAFGRQVGPFYAAPGHPEVPARLVGGVRVAGVAVLGRWVRTAHFSAERAGQRCILGSCVGSAYMGGQP
jgi:pimeloyl-ACP methyl ester carboxylesterase